MKRKNKGLLAGFLAAAMVISSAGTVSAAGKTAETRSTGGKIVVDYNTSIGTGSPELFGGVGTPDKTQDGAWNALAGTMGLKLVKVNVNLAELFPNDADTIDSAVLEDYTHVAGSIFTRINGSGMKAMLQFTDLPAWLDEDGNGMYDKGKEADYRKMLKKFLNEAKGTGYEGIISHVEIAPDSRLSNADFTEMYYEAAKTVRESLPNTVIGGFGYELTSKNDKLPDNVKAALAHNKEEADQTLLQFVSVRGYQAEPTDGNSEKEIFGEFKAGRKEIRKALSNQDMPLYMTGWSTAEKDAQSADGKITGADGIKYHTSALFKAMRDGWNVVLFDGTVSKDEQPGSYTYTMEQDGTATLNPFARVYNLLGNKLGLNAGEFKVVSTDMGSNWPVDDSIAMQNADGAPIMLMTNFGGAKSDIEVELKNVPYEDGKVKLELYIASEDNDSTGPLQVIDAEVLNGIVSASIPAVPAGCAMGVIVKEGTAKTLPAQSMYEFESQDNHFGGNMEIGWTTGASFNRTVSGFGGEDNFITLRKVMADGAGIYTAHLYAANGNGNIYVSVNEGKAFKVDGSSVSLSKSVDFEVELKAGSENTIKVWTSDGELKPDRMVLEAKDVQLSVGVQNLGQLEKQDDGKYVLPLKKTDFTVDARIFPESSAAGKTIGFTSSDPQVVEIDGNGLMTPKATGESVITVSINGTDPVVSQSFTVVIKNAVSSVTVQPSTLNLKQGNSETITVQVLPEDAENRNVNWTTSDASLVEITSQDQSSAVIRAVADSGTATITAATENGKKATCTVIIAKPVEGGSINIDYGNTISTGNPEIFGVTHYPSVNKKDSDIGDHSIVWPMLTNQAGVRFMRADVRLQEILPIWTKTPDTNWEKPSSYNSDQPNYVKSDYYYVTGPDGQARKFNLDDYKADMEYYEKNEEYLNGLSNPENWNTDRFMNWISAADEQGYEIMAMTFQIPEWLSAGELAWGDPSTKKVCNGAPKDWGVYRDIVKKVYKMLRDKIDYYEFLNEPHWYIPTHGDQKNPEGKAYSGSNMVNEIAADQFYQAIDAIYEAEAEITGAPNAEPVVKLGGGADDGWIGDYGVLGTLFSDSYAKYKDRVDFVSIHKYGERPANQDDSNSGTANSRNVKYWLRQKTGRDIPLFLNEYNVNTGQPTDETYGYKSVGWHAKNLIDMMIDGYEGGGYYTCYPADVPMDDYEASSGWVERGKGMYTWNNGDPYLANFTKTWGLMSVDLGLGDGRFAVKSTSIDGSMSQAIGAVNAAGNAVAFVNNYASKSYDHVNVKMENLPYAAGSEITATIYRRTYDTEFEPVNVTAEVSENGSAVIQIPEISAWAVAGIAVSGTPEAKQDKTYEFESYRNTLKGKAKIEKNSNASNGRLVTGAVGADNAVVIPVGKDADGMTKLTVNYNAEEDSTLTYVLGDKTETIELPADSVKAEIDETLPAGETPLTFYVSSGSADLDCVVRTDMDKTALQALVDQVFTQEGYTVKSWAAYTQAKADAQAVLDNENATAEDVQNAYKALSDAIDGLVVMVDLEELVNKTSPVLENSGEYETSSWTAFVVSLKKAQAVLADETATQEMQIEAYKVLEGAYNGLRPIEKEESKSLIEGRIPTSNTEIARPEKATDGNTDTSDADQNSFTQLAAGDETGGSDNGYSNWQDVYLQYDFGAEYLVNKVDVYRTIYNNGGYIRWRNCKIELSTDEKFADGTVTVIAEDEELQTQAGQTAPQEVTLSEAVKARYIRVSGRGHIGSWGGYSNKVNFSEIQVFGAFMPTTDVLRTLLEDAKAIENDNYTTATWEALQAEIKKAETLLEKTDLTQAQINDAAANLAVTVEQLIKKADTAALEEQIKVLDEKTKEETWNKLSEKEQKAFRDLLENAGKLLGEETIKQSEVDNMTAEVKKAVQELTEKYDEIQAVEIQKQVLKEAIEEAEKTKLDGYTKESIEAFRKALSNAKKVLEEGRTKEEFRAAFEELDNAKNGLSKPEPEKPDNPNNPDNNGGSGGNGGSGTSGNKQHNGKQDKAAPTGDTARPAAAAGMAVISLLVIIAAVIVIRKKRQEG